MKVCPECGLLKENTTLACDCGWSLDARPRSRWVRLIRKAQALLRRMWVLPEDGNRMERIVLWEGRRLLLNVMAFLFGLLLFRVLPARFAGSPGVHAGRALVGADLWALLHLNVVVCGGWIFALLGKERERTRRRGLAGVAVLAVVAFIVALLAQMPLRG
jgi:hypothetical protein